MVIRALVCGEHRGSIVGIGALVCDGHRGSIVGIGALVCGGHRGSIVGIGGPGRWWAQGVDSWHRGHGLW